MLHVLPIRIDERMLDFVQQPYRAHTVVILDPVIESPILLNTANPSADSTAFGSVVCVFSIVGGFFVSVHFITRYKRRPGRRSEINQNVLKAGFNDSAVLFLREAERLVHFIGRDFINRRQHFNNVFSLAIMRDNRGCGRPEFGVAVKIVQNKTEPFLFRQFSLNTTRFVCAK